MIRALALAVPALFIVAHARAEDAAALRARGPVAFAELYGSMRDTIEQYRVAHDLGHQLTIDELEPQIRLLDAVAAQRDAYASGLYWFTDLDTAVAEAQRTGKPILSLRLLGNLDEELSCANSRFFRTVLYADTRLQETLRERFVLHWQSVRPVPVVTIDFGDGRVLQRTVTGNSIHYVLDARGRVVDALPGLYAPRAFEWLLDDAGALAQSVGSMDDTDRRAALMAWHADRIDAPAPVVDATLDAGSIRLMRDKTIPAEVAGRIAISKAIVEDPLLRTVRNLEASLAQDTARNERDLHRRIHERLAAGELLDDLPALNDWVYAELFLTPADDPWLGLAPPDVYSALDRGGVAPR